MKPKKDDIQTAKEAISAMVEGGDGRCRPWGGAG